VFDAQIVLVGVRRFEIRVYDRRASIEAREGPEGIQEIYIVVERLAKGVGSACRPKWIAQECVPRGSSRGYIRFVDADVGGCVERCLTVELKVVLCLQHIIEKAPPSSDAGLSVVERLPCKTESRCEVRFVGEIDPCGCALVAGEKQSQRCAGKHRGLWGTRNYGISASLGVRLRRAVLIA
jgi:hypothetical protein